MLILSFSPWAAADTFVRHPLLRRPVVELRGGVDASTLGPHPAVCAEVAPHRFVALEACGTGAGILVPGPGDDLVHFRAEASVPVMERDRVDLTIQAGAGFAEVQRGEDAPGFLFGPARSETQTSGAGPEASGAVKARVWTLPGVYVSAEVTAGAAWIPAAPVVTGGGTAVVPFGGMSVGVGF